MAKASITLAFSNGDVHTEPISNAAAAFVMEMEDVRSQFDGYSEEEEPSLFVGAIAALTDICQGIDDGDADKVLSNAAQVAAFLALVSVRHGALIG